MLLGSVTHPSKPACSISNDLLTVCTLCTNKYIRYLLDDLHQILQNLSTLTNILVCDDRCG